MSGYAGDIRLGETHNFKFTTRQISGAPATLASSPVISAYPDNSTTQVTAGITLTVDFDSVTGYNNIAVVASGGNGYLTATDYDLAITTGTVNSVSVVGESVAAFSIENRSGIRPVTAGRQLLVDANGVADARLADAVSHGGTLGSSTATFAMSRVNVTSQTSNTVGLTVAGNGSGSGATITGGTTGHGLSAVGGATSGDGISAAASTSGHGLTATGVGTTKHGLNATGGATTSAGISATGGATSGDGFKATAAASGKGINAAGAGTTMPGILATGGGTTSAGISIVGGGTSGDGILVATTSGHGVNITATGASKHGMLITGGDSGTSDGLKLAAGSGGVGLRAGSLTVTGATILTGAVTLSSTLGVAGTTTLAAVATGAVTLDSATVTNALLVSGTTTLTGAVSLGSTLGVTGTTTLAAVTTTGTMTLNALTVSGATTLTGAVSLGSTLGITGTTTLAALTTTGTVTFNALTVSNATTLTGTVSATGASNDIRGVQLISSTASDAVLAAAIWNAATASYGSAGSYGLLIETDLDAAISSRGTGVALSAAGVRTAIGMASANLDTQIDGLPTAAEIFAATLTTAMTEAYAADGAAPTLAQAVFLIQQSLHEFAISGTTRTVKKLDKSTTAATFTLDDADAPTSTTRAT